MPYLKCSLYLTGLLLQYDDKELDNHFRKHKIEIEMFATNWLLTLFTRVIEFGMIYELWEIFLLERDKYFLFYFAVGFIIT